jgi:hypothetical protein
MATIVRAPIRDSDNFEEGYLLGTREIPNGEVPLKIHFVITHDGAAMYIAHLLPRVRTLGPIMEHYNAHFKQIVEEKIQLIISRMIGYYGTFPTSSTPLKEIFVVFTITNLDQNIPAATIHKANQPDILWILLVSDLLVTFRPGLAEPSRLEFVFSNQLYRFVRIMKKSHEDITAQVEKLALAIQSKQKANKTIIDQNTAFIIEGMNKQKLPSPDPEDLARASSLLFESGTYHSLVMESGLSVIAVEIGDEAYLESCLRADAELIAILGNFLGNVNNYKQQYQRKGGWELQKVLALLRLYSFMFCYQYMPVSSVSLAFMTSHFWNKSGIHQSKKSIYARTAKTIIQEYRVILQNQCDCAVRRPYLKFFGSFIRIFYRKIPKNTLNPNIEARLEQLESIRQAKEAFKILNREFKVVFDHCMEEYKKEGVSYSRIKM